MLQDDRTGEVVVHTSGSATVSYAPVVAVPRTARVLTMEGPGAVELLRAYLPGWRLSVTEIQGEVLLQAGARLRRHAHTMRRDLCADPPPPEWSGLVPAGPLSVRACDRPAVDLLPAWREAFPPEHPDRVPGGDRQILTELLQPLLTGRILGPLLDCSALVTDAGDRVVAGLMVNDHGGVAWVGDVFRRPEAEFAGLGGLLLRRALARLSAHGRAEVGLAVTVGNPAQRLYERLGFTVTETSMSVMLP